MTCWMESDLELAAIRIVDAEGVGMPAPIEIRAVVSHTASCHRCGDLLEGFLDVERRFRAELDWLEGARWIELSPVSDSGVSLDVGSEETPEPFKLAAATPGSLSDSPIFNSHEHRTFRSTDGSYVVVLQPDAEETGDLATLVRSIGPTQPPTPAGESPAPPAAPGRIGLTVGLQVYWFDGKGNCRVPALPRRRPFLVLI